MSPGVPELTPKNCVRHEGIEGFGPLALLALDLRWSWNHAADEIWQEIDLELWDQIHNPWGVLQTVSRERIERVLGDPAFRTKVEARLESRRRSSEGPAWFQEAHPGSPLTGVAYFSMEFMLSEALPIYSGGLGNVAGDQLKAASDLGVPVIGVGLLYQQGYFRQAIDRDGNQEALFPYNEPGQLPITPVRTPNGEWLRVSVDLLSGPVSLRVWQVQVGRVKLYLLDSNDFANSPLERGITSELYGGGPELRLQQEIVLGVGGWKVLHALGLDPEVCHLNEGHAAFAVLERARVFMEKTGYRFDVALAATRKGNLFTTHTAVPAGFDRFDPGLIERYLGSYVKNGLGISFDAFLALGRENAGNSSEPFNMAYLAVRGSGAVNGVSRLHGKVSRTILAPLFPRWPLEEIPVGHVTNGIHVPSWDSEAADALWTKTCGKNRWRGTTETIEALIRKISDDDLWAFRNESRTSLVEYVRKRVRRERTVPGASDAQARDLDRLLDPSALTLGFARRFATYKRPNLLLSDPARLVRLLTSQDRPVQLVIAGKAHPADRAGQELIREWIRFIERTDLGSRVVFLGDYDMLLAERLVQGVDVWINTPRRPWEACGTSGMKVLVNGGLNCSELDGWWAEAYTPEVGWALGDGLEHGDDPAVDKDDALSLYDRLEQEIVPSFYSRNGKGVPVRWVGWVRESMATLTHAFSANRSVREYVETHYLPAAEGYRERCADDGSRASDLLSWLSSLENGWNSLRFGEVNIETRNGLHVFRVEVELGEIPPEAVRVELYATGLEGLDPERYTMERVGTGNRNRSRFLYRGEVPEGRKASDYTPRMVPFREGVSVPMETCRILWQR
ncbi:MAG: alpha-glucan family phosphorylase [Leptospirales bacterium]